MVVQAADEVLAALAKRKIEEKASTCLKSMMGDRCIREGKMYDCDEKYGKCFVMLMM